MGIKTGNRKIETGELKYTRHADQNVYPIGYVKNVKNCGFSVKLF